MAKKSSTAKFHRQLLSRRSPLTDIDPDEAVADIDFLLQTDHPVDAEVYEVVEVIKRSVDQFKEGNPTIDALRSSVATFLEKRRPASVGEKSSGTPEK